jgi:hypothetical protein
MNKGPHNPGHRGGHRRRRKHGSQGSQGGQGSQGSQGSHGPHHQGGGKRGGGRQRGPAFVGPMDHSYRNAQNGNSGNQFRGGLTPQFFQHPDIEPLPDRLDTSTRIFAFVDDLFFQTKIQDTARKLNVKVEFVKTDQEIFDRLQPEGVEPPSLIIFDLNNANAKPLSTVPKLRAKLKKATTSILGFVSHVQGDLKIKAQEAGCDAVMPRSAFSQNLPQILRRHGAADDLEEQAQ